MTKKKGSGSPAINTRSKSSSPSSPSPDLSPTTKSEILTQEYLKDQIASLKSEMRKILDKQRDEIIDHLTNENILLKAEMLEIHEKIKQTENENITLKRDVVNMQQYIRRNNVEICGIPDSVSDNKLEEKVIQIAQSINVNIQHEEIEACHRLPKGPRERNSKTIVRFVNRKSCELLHTNKKKLKNTNLYNVGIENPVYINCNLCPHNKFIWGKCKKLHNDQIIDRFWVYNGFVYYACDDMDKGTKVQHLDDLQKVFPGYDFSSKF